MSGEKLKDLEQGHVTEVAQEEKPQIPPKFLYEVCTLFEVIAHCNFRTFIFILLISSDRIHHCRRI